MQPAHVVHALFAQVCVPVHAAHAAPLFPQLALVFPGSHVEPFRHPLVHVPPPQPPPVQVCPPEHT